MESDSSIASGVSQRKRGAFPSQDVTRPSNRRRLQGSTVPSTAPQTSPPRQNTSEDIEIIKSKYGGYQHHGTGNPLARRAPSSRTHLAVRNLAQIIQDGVLGQVHSSNSIPSLKTERGSSNGSFWTCRLELAGSYGWTGLVLPQDCKTNTPLPMEQVTWFLVDTSQEMELLKTTVCESDKQKWEQVQERVITVSQLAKLARGDNDG